MPVYGGGKAKFGHDIYTFIKRAERICFDAPPIFFCPFAGLLGVSIHAAADARKVVASDKNADLIAMWRALQSGWEPPSKPISKKSYDELREVRHAPPDPRRGFFGIACAYSGIFFAGYRISAGPRNFFKTFRTSLMDMTKHIRGIKFIPEPYDKFEPRDLTIYCDPPYRGNQFRSDFFSTFDHDAFWREMRVWSKNNLVIISEYEAPADFACVWSKEINSVYNQKTKVNRECLFMYKKSKFYNLIKVAEFSQS